MEICKLKQDRVSEGAAVLGRVPIQNELGGTVQQLSVEEVKWRPFRSRKRPQLLKQ
ncbi:hypothetical protein GQF01_02005 [Paenibacillus sp. 5J-6]|uniref:Uncharacterized protein n=1 Tax=Paenibacillus silvestris TaxID=2606219 RepID=A0A6L8US91_9BACL|nr:hypothetical protein [Paenibacillus silvestris]MZQ80913.1 hypothetical protein [Paenibacillus silvestris]